MSSPGARGGWSWSDNPAIETRSTMLDVRQQLTQREAFAQGVGKAHRSVVYAHFDFRNTKVNTTGTTGRV